MKKATFSPRVIQIQDQYYEYVRSGKTISLENGINFNHFKLSEYCSDLCPHPHSEEIIDITRSYCEKYGIWTEKSKHYVTCELFLYPTAEFHRMLTMVLNNAIDYYLNDLAGRDIFEHLSSEEQERIRIMIERMASINEDLSLLQDPEPIEIANIRLLQDIKKHSTNEWFLKFLALYKTHLDVTHRNGNTSASGKIPTVREYIDLRCHTSGMHHIVLLIQYAKGNFIERNQCLEAEIFETLERINILTAQFGCLSNDLFSFEKEVIDEGTDANLVMIIAQNEPTITFIDAVQKSTIIVSNVIAELIYLIEVCRNRLRYTQNEKTNLLNEHLNDIEKCIQASWLWQVYTQRYKRQNSIWNETQLQDQEVIKQAV